MKKYALPFGTAGASHFTESCDGKDDSNDTTMEPVGFASCWQKQTKAFNDTEKYIFYSFLNVDMKVKQGTTNYQCTVNIHITGGHICK